MDAITHTRQNWRQLDSWSIIFTVLIIVFPLFSWAQSDRERSSLTCRLSAFMTADRESVTDKPLRFEGRGILTCRNGGGFTSELPLQIDLLADADTSKLPGATEIALSGNSSPFVVPRDVNQIQDSYRTHASSSGSERTSSKALLRGNRHDVLIELSFSSHLAPVEDLQVISMDLRLDEKSPRLNPEPPDKRR